MKLIIILIFVSSIISGVLDPPKQVVPIEDVIVIERYVDYILNDVVNGNNVEAVKKIAHLNNFIERIKEAAEKSAIKKQYKNFNY